MSNFGLIEVNNAFVKVKLINPKKIPALAG